MTISTTHTNACFHAWMQCEELLKTLHTKHQSLSRKFLKVVDECALVCMSTFHAIKSLSSNIRQFALLCVGLCEECAELCEQISSPEFVSCASVCRNCSENLMQLAFTNLS